MVAGTVSFVTQNFAQRKLRHNTGRCKYLGLGLSFVRRVADVVGVRLDVESAGVGKGSTFSLLVPRAGAARRRRA